MKSHTRKVIFTGLIMLACIPASVCQNSIEKEKPDPYREARIEIKTYLTDSLNPDAGWGYDIHISGLLFIHQPHIPALTGTRGFAAECDARKTAEFAVMKIRKNIIPPTITVIELDSLKVVKIAKEQQ